MFTPDLSENSILRYELALLTTCFIDLQNRVKKRINKIKEFIYATHKQYSNQKTIRIGQDMYQQFEDSFESIGTTLPM